MSSTPISIFSDITGENYSQLIDQACKSFGYFSVVVRTDLPTDSHRSIVLEELKPNLLFAFTTRRTPGGEIHSAHAPSLNVYTTTPRRIRPILKAAGSLFGWRSPAYPEDLCFYRSDRSLAVVSIAHEGIAWFFEPTLVLLYLDGLEWNQRSEMAPDRESIPNPFMHR